MNKLTITERLASVEAILKNHVLTQLKELRAWQWRLVFVILASVFAPLTLAIILRVLKII